MITVSKCASKLHESYRSEYILSAVFMTGHIYFCFLYAKASDYLFWVLRLSLTNLFSDFVGSGCQAATALKHLYVKLRLNKCDYTHALM